MSGKLHVIYTVYIPPPNDTVHFNDPGFVALAVISATL